jgi:putative ABC transport system ATP-binding protein
MIAAPQTNVLSAARGVTKVYGDGALAAKVLHEVHFELPRGQLTLLVGPSGSGKTTLVSILAGVMRASGGVVELCGRDITQMSEAGIARVRRAHVGFVFQTDNLFPALSALDNVAEVLRMKGRGRDEALRLARQALERVGLGHRLGNKPGEMSGGQRQRVAIARAIADGPELLIGDEITAALDGTTALSVMELVRAQVTARSAALLVTHDRRLERFADRVVEMEDGRIVRDEKLERP